MTYDGKELAAGFRTVRANTVQLAEMHTHSNTIDDLVPHLTRQFQDRMAQHQQAQRSLQAQR